MSIWGRIFGTKSVIDNAAKGIYNGVDKAIYTKEEKAAGFLALLKAYEPFKLAQRILAFMVVGAYVATWLLVVLLFVIAGALNDEQLFKAAMDLGSLNNDTLGIPVTLVLGFYFGGGALEGVVDRFKPKKAT